MKGLNYKDYILSLSNEELFDLIKEIESDCGKQVSCDNCPHRLDIEKKCKLNIIMEVIENESKINR
jgi:hypothetical protein